MDPSVLPFFGIVGEMGFAADREVHFDVDPFCEKAAVADVPGSEEVAGFIESHTAVVGDQFRDPVFIGAGPAYGQAKVKAVFLPTDAGVDFGDGGAVKADAKAPAVVVIFIIQQRVEPWNIPLCVGRNGDDEQ